MQHYVVLDGKYLTSFSPIETEHDAENALKFIGIAKTQGIAYALSQITGLECVIEEKPPMKNNGMPCVIRLYKEGFFNKEMGKVQTIDEATVFKGITLSDEYIAANDIAGFTVRKRDGALPFT